MADRLSDGRPNEIAKHLKVSEMKVDLHGLEHQIMRYKLEILRWEDSIRKHHETIEANEQRVVELSKEIEELENG